jgi:hypothetical protein
VFVVFSVLSVGVASCFSGREELGKGSSLWAMLASIPMAAEHVSSREMLFELYGLEFVKLIILLTISALTGRVIVWWYRDRD